MRCQNCDYPVPEGSAFCPNCGVRVEAAPPAPATAETTVLRAPQLPPAEPPARPTYAPEPAYQPPAMGIPRGTLPQAEYPAALPNSNMAVVSLIFGLVGWFLPFVGAAVAIITGHIARRQIRDSGGTQGGGGMAKAGLVLGYVQLGFYILMCVLGALLIGFAAANS